MNCWEQQYKSYVTTLKAVKCVLKITSIFTQLQKQSGEMQADKELTMEALSQGSCYEQNTKTFSFPFTLLPPPLHLEFWSVSHTQQVSNFPCETSPNSRMLQTFHYRWMRTPRGRNTVTETKTRSRVAKGTNKDTHILAASLLIFELVQSMFLGTVIRGKVKWEDYWGSV